MKKQKNNKKKVLLGCLLGVLGAGAIATAIAVPLTLLKKTDPDKPTPPTPSVHGFTVVDKEYIIDNNGDVMLTIKCDHGDKHTLSNFSLYENDTDDTPISVSPASTTMLEGTVDVKFSIDLSSIDDFETDQAKITFKLDEYEPLEEIKNIHLSKSTQDVELWKDQIGFKIKDVAAAGAENTYFSNNASELQKGKSYFVSHKLSVKQNKDDDFFIYSFVLLKNDKITQHQWTEKEEKSMSIKIGGQARHFIFEDNVFYIDHDKNDGGKDIEFSFIWDSNTETLNYQLNVILNIASATFPDFTTDSPTLSNSISSTITGGISSEVPYISSVDLTVSLGQSWNNSKIGVWFDGIATFTDSDVCCYFKVDADTSPTTTDNKYIYGIVKNVTLSDGVQRTVLEFEGWVPGASGFTIYLHLDKGSQIKPNNIHITNY